MSTPFWKMHGAGNDFILVDDRDGLFPKQDASALAALCRRRTGIGCEGLILIQPSESAEFRMQFFNPDGNEVEMCGNGARCVARLAHDLGIAADCMTIETRAGVLSAALLGDQVRLELPPPPPAQLRQSLVLPSGDSLEYDFLNTGVPHVVLQTDDLEGYPLQERGRAVREHAVFAPAGTNVNVFAIQDEHHVRVRTYERGVEHETLACGTGIVASTIAAVLRGLASTPVTVRAASGDSLVVDCQIEDGVVSGLTLTGPAVYVFKGEFQA
ncbi:MAG: diaminopimelate epimerase [Verrucomicrobia bacterium]|jgi:diaminopimelate epimerase|nr:diaminopimelate epimerase [Verrucomicrobiota bacterium]